MKQFLPFPAKIILLLCILVTTALGVITMQSASLPAFSSPQLSNPQPVSSQPQLLTDPFLQAPTLNSVQVVWFTEFEGTQHVVEYGDDHDDDFSAPLTTSASTTQLSRTREDGDSEVPDRVYSAVTDRPIWRHAATVTDLTPGERLSYRVTSQADDGQVVMSDRFTLSAAPAPGQPLTILLTSDHQLKPLAPANLQKVEELLNEKGTGPLDAVFFAGDLVNIPDRASEWFDNAKGLAFFPGLQGRSTHDLEKEVPEEVALEEAVPEAASAEGVEGVEKEVTTTRYTGGQLIQHAPLFPIVGNHEVMGRYSDSDSLKFQYANTLPREQVDTFYPLPDGDTAVSDWIANHSYNTQTYEEIFSLPTTTLPDGRQTSTYYATTFGDIRLVSLYVTQIWRSPALNPDTKGRYREKAEDINQPENWGYGQHIFEDIRQGSAQYSWLEQELASDEFKQAKYKIVMLHHPPHTLGGNVVPAFTDPVAVKNYAETGELASVQYDYPREADYIIRDLTPLLEAADVQLVFYGHSHLWNRFVGPSGMHFLETSNVGNSYGAHTADNPRGIPTDEKVANAGDLTSFGDDLTQDYITVGDPNGLAPVVPTIAPLKDERDRPLPYIASNDITSFTLLEITPGEKSTGEDSAATLSSYYFDTRRPDSAIVKFDEFTIGPASLR